ncbi:MULTISPECIES: signal recognition particle-docking protein FtsY [Alteromonadaceae]|jgi:fused signal recognition particle receptor|uniref:Signal recognition particle receptor FtsY n=1 Tax=Brumicola blandensis TaxID=3075611 RepID=A0AAW8R0Y0_9ALTE|nr:MULTISPECIES: signal recognition particle-docking protein FtsY [unclassified Alteromonas]MDT0582394.1 signal recognition particle-docking protein FtsY [Alteromonas sp. W409]MDT0628616.1 signal recognition particle-docking protein FtsY [Alteromonas sp. W364]
MANLFNWFKKDQSKSDSKSTESEAIEDKAITTDTDAAETLEDTSFRPAQNTELEDSNVEPVDNTELVESETLNPVDPHLPAASETEPAQEPTKSEATQEKPASKGFFSRLRDSLSRTKESIGTGFISLFAGKKIDDELYEELETQLLIADVGMTTTSKIINKLTESAKLSQLKDGEALYDLLKQQMRDLLEPVSSPLNLDNNINENGEKEPFVILMVGVNGVGKTTTIGKLAKQFQNQGKKVMLAAGDTFRAAAVEQLQVWGERNDIPVVAQQTGSDSASVIFDALASAKAKGADVLIADTAGRLQNKDNLIEELKKVVRVMKKINPNAPHEIMLTLDASTGQNAVSQTKIFNDAVGITGINLTKLDGTAKGGIIFSLADQFGIPIRYIGIGEGIDDLKPFEAQQFVDALFSQDVATEATVD